MDLSNLDLSAIPETERGLLFRQYRAEIEQILRAQPKGTKVTRAKFVEKGTTELKGPARFRRQRPSGEIDPNGPEVYDEQVIEPLNARDKALLQAAKLDIPGETRESAVIVLRTDRGEEVACPIFLGFEFGVPESMFIHFKLAARERLSQLKREGKIHGEVIEMEFNHVHPAVDVILSPPGVVTPQLRFNSELDRSDLNLSREQSVSERGLLFTIRAVSPNGYAYKASFRDGKFVEPSPQLPQGTILWPIRSS